MAKEYTLKPQNEKELLLSLKASVVLKIETFNVPVLTFEMIGVNLAAEQLFLAHQETGFRTSEHVLPQTNIKMNVSETDGQIIIRVAEELDGEN